MRFLNQRTFRWLATALSVAATTLLLSRFGARSTTAGMVYLVLVVWAATQVGLALSLATAIVCAILFDFFFLPPFHTFFLAGAQEYVAMLAFVASSLVAGRVAEHARRQTRQAEQRRADLERLYNLSQEMMLHEDAMGLVAELPKLIRRVFELEEVVLFVTDQDEFYDTAGEVAPTLGESLRTMLPGPSAIEAPHGFSAMALMLGLNQVGALAWKPANLSHEVATAVSAQTAIAMTRATAIQTSMRLEATRESERLRTALIDSLTHELRTPLTSIRAAATTLKDDANLDDETRRDMASILDEESARLDALIGSAIEMAEIDAKVVQVRLLPQTTRITMERAIEDSQKSLAHLQITIDAEEPDLPVWFDPQLIRRVFRHLLENAGRYCESGRSLTLRSRRFQGRLIFIVEDNGPGIDTTDLPLIFEKFYRGKRTTSRKGSGMGLAIVRAILISHGGGIEASSAPGKGTSFRFWVPLLEREPSGAHRRIA